MDKPIFGQRPKGQGVSPAQWKKWHTQFDNAQMPPGMPKHPLTKEVFLAGAWLAFQLEKLDVPADQIQHECSNLGSSAMMLAQTKTKTDVSLQFIPQDIWKLAQEVVTRYAAQEDC